ncbi:MAG: hypothetical protein NVSMB33_10310 [Ktedonobacteraceae bacterium]
MRYDTFKATAFDLGNMDQVLWNTIHGRWFQFTNQAVDWYGPPTRLAIHFEPIILPLSLLYVFHADPRILLVFQTLALTAGSVPVFLLTRKYLPEWPLLAALMTVAYLLSPALLGLNIFDFHPMSLATPLLLYAVLALTYKRYIWFIVACILAASCKEDIPLFLAILGLFLIWKYKLPRLGLALTIGGLLWSFLTFGIIIPHFYPGAQHNNFWYRYESLGSSPGEAIVNVILHPWLLFTTFITLDRVYYLASLFRSSGFLCLLAPEWLLMALPGLAENLLSTDSLLYTGVYHYNAAIIPFVMLSSIHGTRRLIWIWRTWRGETKAQEVSKANFQQGLVMPFAQWKVMKKVVMVAIVVRSFIITSLKGIGRTLAYMRLDAFMRARYVACKQWLLLQWQRLSERMIPVAKGISVLRLQWITFAWIVLMIGLNFTLATPLLNSFWADHQPGSREQHIQQLLAMIPPDASVSAGDNINPHVSERQHLAIFPSISDTGQDPADTVQYIIVDLNAVFPEDRVAVSNELNHLRRSGQFIQIAEAEGVVLLMRRT